MFSLGTPSSLAFRNAVANCRFKAGFVDPPAGGQSELRTLQECQASYELLAAVKISWNQRLRETAT
jgi:hypothetical protein